jgi:hypothetical protein
VSTRTIAPCMGNIRRFGRTNLTIAQKLEGVGFMELPRIDYRMMCSDSKASDLDSFDAWLRWKVSSWLHLTGIPVGVPGMSWRDGGFTLTSLRERQNTMIIRTICDIMTSADRDATKMMEYFEEEQEFLWEMSITEREITGDVAGVLRCVKSRLERCIRYSREHLNRCRSLTSQCLSRTELQNCTTMKPPSHSQPRNSRSQQCRSPKVF